MTINNLTNQVLETILFKASNPESCFLVSKRFNVASQNVINRVFYDIQIYHLDNQNLNGWDFTEWSLHDIFNQLRRLTSPDHTPESMPGISLQAYQFLSTLHTLRESTIIFWEIHAHDADEDVWLYDLPAAPFKVIQRGLTEWIENTELKYPLKMLDLSRTDITVLPTHVTQLTQLHTIDLRKTGIREGLDNARRIPNILLTPPEELYWEPSTKPPNLKRQKTWPSIE